MAVIVLVNNNNTISSDDTKPFMQPNIMIPSSPHPSMLRFCSNNSRYRCELCRRDWKRRQWSQEGVFVQDLVPVTHYTHTHTHLLPVLPCWAIMRPVLGVLQVKQTQRSHCSGASRAAEAVCLHTSLWQSYEICYLDWTPNL